MFLCGRPEHGQHSRAGNIMFRHRVFQQLIQPTRISLQLAALLACAASAWSAAGSAATFQNVAPMNTGRYSHTATLLPSGKVLIAAGASAGGYLASAELYDPAADTWQVAGSLATARTVHVAALLPAGKVLVAGGFDSSGSPIGSAEIYDPAMNVWTVTGSLAEVRYQATATTLQSGKVLVVGGANYGGRRVASTELYDPDTGAWSSSGSLATARIDHTATLLPSGEVLVAAGETDGVTLSSAEIYNPASNSWRAAGSLTTARYGHRASALASGRVLVTGGKNGNTGALFSDGEIWDPQTDTWASAGSIGTPILGHTQTLLGTGQVLVAGGWDGSGSIGVAELYDESTNAWSPTGALVTPRYDHSETLLASGSVLLTGGYNTLTGIVLASSEVYASALPKVAPATFWIGLKNSDDQGTQFDLRTEIYVNDSLVSGGEVRCVTGVTRNAAKATSVALTFDAASAGGVVGDNVAVKVLTRIGTNPDGSKCAGHANATGLVLYYDAASRTSGFASGTGRDLLSGAYLHSSGSTNYIDDTAPTASAAKSRASASVNFAGGNIWQAIGTWSGTVQ
jgi:hypothetical protein